MSQTLGEHFVKSKGHPIEFKGLWVHSIYFRKVLPDTRVKIRFASASAERNQALRLKLEKGKLLVNGKELKDVVLWKQTSPEVVEMRCKTPRCGSRLKIWNAWQDESGVMQAWIGNAGMLIQQQSDRVILHCSDGMGASHLDDLVVEIDFEFCHKEAG